MGGDGGAKNLWRTTNAEMLAKYTRIGASEPARKGDIAVWSASMPGSGGYGHVAIVLADKGSHLSTFSQNPGAAQIKEFRKEHLLGYFRPNSGVVSDTAETSSPSSSLVRNGSGEAGAAYWSRRAPAGGTTNFVATSSGGRDGSRALAANSTNGGSIFQDVAVSTGPTRSVTASAWVRAQSGTASGRLCVWALGVSSPEASCATYTVGTTWTPLEVVSHATRPHDKVRVEFYLASGTTWMDTISLN